MSQPEYTSVEHTLAKTAKWNLRFVVGLSARVKDEALLRCGVSDHLAQTLMEEFADATGVSGKSPPRRYLWTDAFAVCNFLGLYRETGDRHYLEFASTLIDQVHHILGRHREDDSRRGWISGLSEHQGEKHPTCRGLRIGKPMNERQPGAPPDERLEWDQDGQYFHYLTKWMHALHCLNRQTGDRRYYCWAVELAVIAHSAFTREAYPGGPKHIAWKMSIDLSQSLVSSMGQHDALDGLVTFLELQTVGNVDAADGADLAGAIANMTAMCEQGRWPMDDPLGIGGLLDDATRLARLIFEQKVASEDLLRRLLIAVESSLRSFGRSNLLRRRSEQRLPFRELGLSIGLQALEGLHRFTTTNRNLAAISDRLLVYQPLAEQIENFRSHPAHRLGRSWCDHRDIYTVMLATSLAPAGYLGS